jgi:hypothetical protein
LDRPQLGSASCKVRRETAARFYRSGEIVEFAHLGRSMLQNAGDETGLLGCIGGYEGGGRSAEVMQTHGFAELGSDVGADKVVDAA